MSYDWLKLECALAGRKVPARHTFFSVNGTASPDPFGPGFSGDLARTLDDELWYWQPIGYPAATFPMGPSVKVGRQELINQIIAHPGKFALSGYSQGALVVDYVWRDDILSPSGVLHSRLADVIGIVNFGDPMRCPGVSNGNLHAGIPIAGPANGFTTGGIAGPNDLQLTQTPDFLLSCNNPGDLYGAAPVGDAPWTTETGVGHDETLIFNIIQDFNVPNVLAIVEEVMSLMGMFTTGINLSSLIGLGMGAIGGALGGVPATGARTPGNVIAIVEALLNGGMFFLSGMGPHMDYAKYMPAMTDFIMRVGKANY